MPQKKFIISFVGSPCAGKSTAAKLLSDKLSDIYFVSYDKQKWFLSGFDRHKHYGLVKEITFGLFEMLCQKGVPIQLEYFRTEEEYQKCVEVSKKYGYTLICIELTAPRDVLIERFRERVSEAKRTGEKLSFTSEDIFIENIDSGYYCPENIISFDTTKVSAEEIVEKTLELVNEKLNIRGGILFLT